MMFKAYHGPLPIHPCCYVLPLGTCRSSDLSVEPCCGDEHDARDTIRIYTDTMHEDAMEYGDLYVRASTQQELKIAERVARLQF